MASVALVALGVVLVVLSGIALSFQTGVNATLGKVSGKSFASVVSFTVGLAALIIFFVIDTYGIGAKGPTVERIKAVPWWGWLGGLLGGFYVVCTIFFAQILGAGVLTSIFVTSQLVTSILLDCYGIVGFEKRKLRWERILGACFLIVGVLLISLYRGDVQKPAPTGLPTSINEQQSQVTNGHPIEKSLMDLTGDQQPRTPPLIVVELQTVRG
jgi:uncharacterized membrane protein YdcZ (DUF606 family)